MLSINLSIKVCVGLVKYAGEFEQEVVNYKKLKKAKKSIIIKELLKNKNTTF